MAAVAFSKLLHYNCANALLIWIGFPLFHSRHAPKHTLGSLIFVCHAANAVTDGDDDDDDVERDHPRAQKGMLDCCVSMYPSSCFIWGD